MTRTTRAFILLALAFICLSANAQQVTAPPASATLVEVAPRESTSRTTQTAPANDTPADVSTSLETILLKEQIKHLQEQNRSIEDYHESVLTTSYFALGTAITLTVLLLGYSYWFNTRAYENDKQNLKEGLEKGIAAAEDRITAKEQGQRSNSESAINARVDAISAAAGTNYAQLRSELVETRKAAEQSAALTDQKISLFKREFRTIEDLVWSVRGVHSNSVLALAEALELCATDDDDQFFDIFADRFERRINELRKSNHKISSNIKNLALRKIESLREKRPDKTGGLVDKLNQLEIESDTATASQNAPSSPSPDPSSKGGG